MKMVSLQLFDDKIGPEYDVKLLSEIYKNGKERYSNKIPPGYKDTNKHDDDRHRFGDLIIWLQIIEHARAEAKDIIFVTDDKKEDWWEEYKDNRLGPRHELIREFRVSTNNQMIWFYTPDRFLQYAKSKAGISVKPKTIEEVKRPVIDWPSLIGQGTIPGQVSWDAGWPFVSLGESEPLDRISSLLSHHSSRADLFSAGSNGQVANADWMRHSGLLGDGLSLVGGKTDEAIGGLTGISPEEKSKSKADEKKSEDNQDKDE